MSVATLPNPTAPSVSVPSRTPPPKAVVPSVPKSVAASTPFQTPVEFRLWSVPEYERMIDLGLLGEDEPVELIEGFLVLKMSRNNEHDRGIRKINKRFVKLVPDDWTVQCQCAIVFDTSKPEPDFSICRGNEAHYDSKQPRASEVALVVEVAFSSLAFDRKDKGRVYARGGVPEYWLVNTVDRVIDVYTDPTGDVADPQYRTVQTYGPGTAVPLVLDGQTVGTLAVDELI